MSQWAELIHKDIIKARKVTKAVRKGYGDLTEFGFSWPWTLVSL